MTTLLEKLKTKPTPNVKEKFEVKISKERKPVSVKDKRSEGLVNREDILRRIFNPEPKTETESKPEPKSEEETKRETDSKSETKRKVPKIKKLKGKKIKIVGIQKGTISTLGDTSTPKPRKTKAPDLSVVSEGKIEELVVGNTIKRDILPKKQEKVLVRASEYYLNNRQIFVTFINKLFKDYRDQILKEKEESERSVGEDIIEEKCNSASAFIEFELLTHQKIVRDYLNLYTPYRGLLLYHGLGSGKTCSSIAIAEGMKSAKPVIIMTPASLRRNYIEELKKCGDPFYKKNQFWRFIPLKSNESLLSDMSEILSLSEDFIRKNDGAWMVNTAKEPNFESLSSKEKNSLDNQLNEMIRNKYQFINYNGLRNTHLDKLTNDGAINPFDNCVVVIDEAHNFISRIVNKLKKSDALSMRLYEYLMSAENCRVVLLSGTPIINYPNEIGILFNILRGYIKTYTIPLNIKTTSKVNEGVIKKILSDKKLKGLIDYVDYKPSTKLLKITRNPFGFVGVTKGRSYKGVALSDDGEMSDDEMLSIMSDIFKKEGIEMMRSGISVNRFKALPDNLDDFQNQFINIKTGEIKNKKLFQRRILGLASYFRSAQEELMPAYDINKDLHIIKIPMSDYQFGIYESARVQERKLESQSSKKRAKGANKDGVYQDSISTYRIFSRAFCNFVFPRTISRPMPNDGEDISSSIENANEDILDAAPAEERINNVDGQFLPDDEADLKKLDKKTMDETYEMRIKKALNLLKENSKEFLSNEALMTYSPKFLSMYENIISPDNEGSHLIYSQFRTLEGIGIFSIILESNGFSRFKIKRNENGIWELNMSDEELSKPCFALYTGTEDVEEKEIIRNIYNSDWGNIPTGIAEKLKTINSSNIMGEIIKVFMITASGAEGISLKNCRFVHITEPYWHPVRVEQVIGRAARICSHKDLPPHLRNVKVFMYLMTFSDKQLESDESIELRLKDKSKTDRKTPLTSDEALNEISNIKSDINKRLLLAVKEAAMDCSLHSTESSKEKLVCFSFGKTEPPPGKFSISPSLSGEEDDVVSEINTKKITWKAKELRIAGKLYAFHEETSELYDYDSYKQALESPGVDPLLVGILEKTSDGKFKIKTV